VSLIHNLISANGCYIINTILIVLKLEYFIIVIRAVAYTHHMHVAGWTLILLRLYF